MSTAATMVLVAAIAAGGLVFDDRVLLGAPIWLKPLKFAISLAVYAVTFAWLISLVQRGRRLSWWLGTAIGVASIIEMAVIGIQVMRGRTSHFNTSTALDTTLWSIMAVTIMILWLATAGVAILLLLRGRGERPGRLADRTAAVAIRLSLIIALGGLAIGFLMTSPTAEQRATMENAPPTVVGAHSVGVPDGGPGLPLVNWSTTGGDLRIGHFIGMHALQALPLLAFALTLAAGRIRRLADERTRVRLVIVVAGAYAALTALVTWQALRGQALIHPDGLTLGTGTVLLAATALGTLWAVRRDPVPAGALLTPIKAVAR